jgi:DcmR-like sensory protein
MNSEQIAFPATSIATDWTRIGTTGHAVQFYEHDGVLADQLASYVGTALVTGDGAVVIGTSKRRTDLRARLALRGLDTAIATREGRYVSLDAESTLRRILSPNGWPDPALFRDLVAKTVDRIIAAVGSDRPRVAAFGEMVALLCASGDYAAAVRLEDLWNELAATYAFSLICAYPMSLFKHDTSAAARFMKICAQHSHVFSADRRNGLKRPRIS